MPCSGGMVYDLCGAGCNQLCGSVQSDCQDQECVEGCHCPMGTFLYDGICVEGDQCPCWRMGEEYPPGAVITDHCNEW